MRPDWLNSPCAPIDLVAQAKAQERQLQLTKPPGSLGRLEMVATRLAGLQGSLRPRIGTVQIVIFAGDHGVAAEGVSAFPQAVTTDMVRNFARGGAAISVLARQLGAELEVINLGTVHDPGMLPGVVDKRLGPGTTNFVHEPALTEAQLSAALQAGQESATRAIERGATLFVGGEMGIANTTTAAATSAALLDCPAATLVGPGTGVDAKGVAHKAAVIERALTYHAPHLNDPFEALRRVGGFEIAGLAGAFIACAQLGLPVLVDGFIATAAGLVAERLRPGAIDWFLFAHTSAEPGHTILLESLGAEPLLHLSMRLGEASGAAAAVPLLRLACALHNEMATFSEAGVAEAIA